MLEKFKARQRKRRRSRGQSLVEYLLLTALLSTLAIGFVSTMINQLWGKGLSALPSKATPCLSQPTPGSAPCQ